MTLITTQQLAREIEDFLAFKHALGLAYQRGAYTLRHFEHFVRQQRPGRSTIALETMIGQWLARTPGRKPLTVALELSPLRQFCLYRRRLHPNSFVPDRDWAPRQEASTFLPYVFSPAEVRQILTAASAYRGTKISACLLRTLILMLYCTGLRLGEAVRIRLGDVDLNGQTFLIRYSKGKTRIVPFGDDLARELKVYLSERNSLVDTTDDLAFLINCNAQPLSVIAASAAIRRLLRQLKLKPPQGRTGPRPYDFRRAFAVHRLTEWYQQGVDIQARLPWLSAYMGHDNILGTEVYLTATPTLMKLASERFEARVRQTRRSQ